MAAQTLLRELFSLGYSMEVSGLFSGREMCACILKRMHSAKTPNVSDGEFAAHGEFAAKQEPPQL
jgi:hypothetical protein